MLGMLHLLDIYPRSIYNHNSHATHDLRAVQGHRRNQRLLQNKTQEGLDFKNFLLTVI